MTPHDKFSCQRYNICLSVCLSVSVIPVFLIQANIRVNICRDNAVKSYVFECVSIIAVRVVLACLFVWLD